MAYKEIWILDFDRCLGSERIYAAAEQALERLSPEAKERIAAVRAAIEREGGSFDLISYLEENDTGVRDKFLEMFKEVTSLEGPRAYRNEGATELIEYLGARNIPCVIMTYGGVAWQEAKIEAAGLSAVSYIVVDTSAKSEKINAWYDDRDHEFHVPFPGGMVARSTSVCLVDDKAQAFKGLSSKARGYWLRSEKMLKSQGGTVPELVTPVNSLADIIELEKQVTN